MTYKSSLHDTQRAFSWSRVRRQVYGEFPALVRVSDAPSIGERINDAAGKLGGAHTHEQAAPALAEMVTVLAECIEAGKRVDVWTGAYTKPKFKGLHLIRVTVAGIDYFVRYLTPAQAVMIFNAIVDGLPAQPAEVTA